MPPPSSFLCEGRVDTDETAFTETELSGMKVWWCCLGEMVWKQDEPTNELRLFARQRRETVHANPICILIVGNSNLKVRTSP